MPRMSIPVEAVDAAIRELDTDLVVKLKTGGGFRAPEVTESMYYEAVTPAVIAALNAIDTEWMLPAALGVTDNQIRQAMLPLAAERGLDRDPLMQENGPHRLLLLRGGSKFLDQLPDGRRWLAVALRAYADLIEAEQQRCPHGKPLDDDNPCDRCLDDYRGMDDEYEEL